MTKDTQDIMARAQEQSNTADAQAAELQRVRMLSTDRKTAWHTQLPAAGCLRMLYHFRPPASGMWFSCLTLRKL